MTDEEFNAACGKLSCDIAKFYDDIEDPTLIMCALLPLAAQSVMNVAYVREVPTTEVLDMFTRDLKFITAKLQAFMDRLHETTGVAQ